MGPGRRQRLRQASQRARSSSEEEPRCDPAGGPGSGTEQRPHQVCRRDADVTNAGRRRLRRVRRRELAGWPPWSRTVSRIDDDPDDDQAQGPADRRHARRARRTCRRAERPLPRYVGRPAGIVPVLVGHGEQAHRPGRAAGGQHEQPVCELHRRRRRGRSMPTTARRMPPVEDGRAPKRSDRRPRRSGDQEPRLTAAA